MFKVFQYYKKYKINKIRKELKTTEKTHATNAEEQILKGSVKLQSKREKRKRMIQETLEKSMKSEWVIMLKSWSKEKGEE